MKPACAGEQHADRDEKRLNALIAKNLENISKAILKTDELFKG